MGKIKKTGNITRLVLVLSIAVLTGSVAVKNINAGSQGSRPSAQGKTGIPGGRAGNNKPGEAGMNEAETVFSVITEKPETAEIREYIKVNGDITAETSVEIYPDTSGKLVKRYVSIGDHVSKGDIIAKIDPSKPGTVYEASPVESTITGTVTRLPGSIGDTVSTASSIAEVGDLSRLQIKVFIPEKEITWIETGLEGKAELAPYKGEYIPVQVTEVSPVIDPDSRTLEVKLAAADAGEERMKSGMFASVIIYTRKADNVLTVPLSAVLSNDKGEFVYTEERGKAAVKYIETGLKSSSRAEVRSGLTEEDSVIVRGQNIISEGSSVRVVEGGM